MLDFFPNTLPIDFKRERDSSDFQNIVWTSRSTNIYLFHDLYTIKSVSSCLNMKLVDPKPFYELIKHVKQGFISEEVKRAVKNSQEFVFRYDSVSNLIRKRNDLLATGQFTRISRLDIRRFFSTFYTHLIEALRVGSIQLARASFATNGLNDTWASKLDQAIRYCQHNESNGIPISGKIFRSIAEVILILLDSIIVDKIAATGMEEDAYCIIGFSDNYDVFSENEETSKICIDCIISAFSEFSLVPNLYQINEDIHGFKFPLHAHFRTMEFKDLKQALDDSVNDPDYEFIILEVSKAFFNNFVKFPKSRHYELTMSGMLKEHPLCVKYFTDLAILHKDDFPSYKKLGTCLLKSIMNSPFRSIVTTQLICVCHYYTAFKMEKSQYSTLSNFLTAMKFENNILVQKYMEALI